MGTLYQYELKKLLCQKMLWISKVWSYLPGAYIGSWTFTEYRLIQIFGKFFNNLQMAPVFWLVASMLFIAIAGCSYKHYQVKGK